MYNIEDNIDKGRFVTQAAKLQGFISWSSS